MSVSSPPPRHPYLSNKGVRLELDGSRHQIDMLSARQLHFRSRRIAGMI